MINTCKHCQIEFDSLRKTKKYCSKECMIAASTKYFQIEVSCRQCGKKITRRGKKKLTAHYCSRSCRSKWSKFNHVPSWRKGIVEGIYKSCEVCQKSFYVFPGESKKKNRRFCSLACRDKGDLSSKQKGEKNHSWKGGRGKIGEYIYFVTENHPFAHKKSRRVAEHRLEMEKKLGRYLDQNEEVHHINGIKTDNRIENLSLTVKKMHFGVIKCPHCLKEFNVK